MKPDAEKRVVQVNASGSPLAGSPARVAALGAIRPRSTHLGLHQKHMFLAGLKPCQTVMVSQALTAAYTGGFLADF